MALGVSGKKVGSAYVELGVLDRDLKRGYKDAETGAHRTGRAMKAGLAIGAVAAAGAVYGLGKALIASGKAAIEAEKSETRMRAQLAASGIAYGKHAAQIEKVIQKQSRLAALDDEELTDSFTKLVRATGDVNKALELNGLAADIARAKNMDVAAAADIVIKANMGNVGALRRQGIEVAKVTTAQDALKASGKKVTDQQLEAAKAADAAATKTTLLGELQKRFAGQAAAYGSSTAGAQERIGVAVENLQESIGKRLLPVVASLLTTLSKWVERASSSERLQRIMARSIELVGDAFRAFKTVVLTVIAAIRTAIGFYERHRAVITALAAVVAGAAAGFVAYQTVLKAVAIATRAYAIVQGILNAVLTANPIGLVVVALGALVAGLIIAYKRSETFRSVVKAAFEGVRNAVATVLGVVLGMIDKWLGGFEAIARAASKLPFVGDKFKGVADKIAAGRDRVQELRSGIEKLKGKRVNVEVGLSFNSRYGATSSASARPGDGFVGASLGALVGQGAAANAPSLAMLAPPASNPGGLQPYVLDELGIGRSFGLSLTSGYRPGSITSTGRPSLHGIGAAIDMAGPAGAMAAYAQAVAGRPGIAEVIYTPVGAWYPGVGWVRPTGSVAADHYDHVHVGARGDGVVGTRDGGISSDNPIFRQGGRWFLDTGRSGARAIPLRRDNEAFFESFQGRGLSPARARVANEWWRRNAPGIIARSRSFSASSAKPRTGDGAIGAIAARSAALNRRYAPQRKAAVAADNQRKAAPINKAAGTAAAAADKAAERAGRDANYNERKWTLAARTAGDAEAAAAAQRSAIDAKIKGERANLASIDKKIAAYRRAAAAARAKGLNGLAASYEAKVRALLLDRRDVALTISELTQDRAEIQVAKDPGGDFDGGGGGGGFDDDFGGGAGGFGGPSPEEVEAQIQERIRAEGAAVLGARSRFLSEYGSNVFSPGPGGLGMGSTELRHVTVKQYFTAAPTDPYVWLRKSSFAAQGAF